MGPEHKTAMLASIPSVQLGGLLSTLHAAFLQQSSHYTQKKPGSK